MSSVNIVIAEKFFKKDPQSSELGKKIVAEGILMLDEMGYEYFTFKKLADRIQSTEASVYRYFDNKLKLLVYVSTWYWSWLEYMIDFETHHIENPQKKLITVLDIVCHSHDFPASIEIPGIDIDALRRVVDIESDKAYFTKRVDEINSKGLFNGYKSLCHKIALVINEVNPQYRYAHSLGSMILESSHQQAFFANHLPSLTEVKANNGKPVEMQISNFLRQTVIKAIS